ncbi:MULTISPECIES: FtsX-like permease family protein [Streptomyces]|uniref:Putative ABC transport system permease protein n=2 Tax=Streptomyces scabiei TaxID=1930 RepID=C9ZCJ0_STRSW|nr:MULTISPECIES: FtsX-like permease family protein [Streptomyces]KFG05615.1 membrane protein [Streptomyces scabiei]MDX2533533.1 FtsX-like permease family protein [Streptomyces scabiei]MDX2574069.1 FtsX-like permease family protein [Streptomyces scabiei]MDX2651241.1 FtsX-like permease family protein [Streptomyces scabiei]MDX2720356.1 FtsX-like permease family protein [Streptomyces scabiei]
MLKATLRSFLAHKGRLLLSALAVVLSVAFVAGSLIFSDTVARTFDRLFASTSADVTVGPKDDELTGQLPTGAVETVPASLARRVAGIDGVADARIDASVDNVTVVDSDNESVGPTTGAPTVARNWRPTDRSPVKLTSGHAPQGDGQALLDADTAKNKGVEIGDTLTVLARPGSFEVRVVGIATFTTTNPGAALVYLDTRTAQTRLLGDPGAATGVSVTAEPGVSDDRLKRRIADELGPTTYEYLTADERAESAAASLGGFLDVIKYVMLGFAGIATLVGIFLIVNTFSMLIAQRTRELGLLRALGADRRQVRRSVLVEAALLGLVGATLGLAAGIGLAFGLIELMGAFGMNLRSTEMVIGVGTPVAAYVVGLGVTFVAAYLPARRASAVSPMAALSDAEIAGVGRPLKVRAVAGGIVGAAGAAALAGCALSSDTGSAASLLGLGLVLTLIATVIAGPLLVRPVIRVLGGAFPALFGSVGRMSQRNALRNPRRTGATASALMVGIALVAGMSVASASMAKSFDDEIDNTLGADFVIQNQNFLPFPQEVTDKVRATDGVGLVVRQRFTPVAVRLPDGERVETTAAAYDDRLDEIANVTYAEGDSEAALGDGAIAMDAEFARDHDVRVGSTIPVRFPAGRSTELRVAALTDQDTADGFGVQGGLYFGTATIQRYVPDGQDSALYVNAGPGTGADELRGNLERTLEAYPQVQVRDQADYKELVRGQIAVLLYLVYALLGLAIVIAVLGVVNTLALSVVERTREIGLLRAIGLGRRQLRRMIRLESVVIAVFGAVLGLVLGLIWGVCAQQVLALQGMKELAIPWGTVVAVVIGSAVVGVVAALLPALRASRMNVLAAIAHE